MENTEQKEFVRNLLTVQPARCPDFFTKQDTLLPDVEKKLNEIGKFSIQKFLTPIKKAQVEDVMLCGNLCGFVYGETSDLDMAIIVNNFSGDFETTKHILQTINLSILSRGFNFMIGKHPIDLFFIQREQLLANYSLTRSIWTNKPIKKTFNFDADFCFKQYCLFSREVHQVVHDLPKINDAFLTPESCDILEKYLNYLKDRALKSKQNHPEHEYCLDYNLFRCLKHFGTYNHFREYIRDSRNFHANRGFKDER